jgi:phenylalanyl-tRNA synthetase alpha chain
MFKIKILNISVCLNVKNQNNNLIKLVNTNSKYFSTIRNVTPQIEEKLNIETKLYKIKNHPLNILRNKIVDFFTNDKFIQNRNKIQEGYLENTFQIKEDFHPIVSTSENFYDLLVEKTNETTSPKNTYYWDEKNVLRTHMTAHDIQMIRAGHRSFITIGDVFRRDSIDATHYPIFHQVDGVRVFEKKYLNSNKEVIHIVRQDLHNILENLNKHLFGDVNFRWVDAYFPFTEPSNELEIFFNEDWLEVLGCGLLREGILKNAGLDPDKYIAWAFGIGLERLAMRLFDIKDIRLFWTKDQRFLNQFSEGSITKFKPYSKYPACYKDITFFINDEFNENDFMEVVRSVAGDLVEDVKCVDTFTNKKTNKTSKCFRILYRHMDKTVTNEEINVFQVNLRYLVENHLKLELR